MCWAQNRNFQYNRSRWKIRVQSESKGTQVTHLLFISQQILISIEDVSSCLKLLFPSTQRGKKRMKLFSRVLFCIGYKNSSSISIVVVDSSLVGVVVVAKIAFHMKNLQREGKICHQHRTVYLCVDVHDVIFS